MSASQPPAFVVNGRRVGPGAPCFVIAEAGVNHNGDEQMALRLVDVAAGAGADAVKFQTFRADRLVTKAAPRARYQAENTGIDESQFEMLRRLELSPELHERLSRYCAERGILFLSTPFDEESADYLASLGMPLMKLPSGEVTNLGLLAHVRGLGLPTILSTGMSDIDEVGVALRTLLGEEQRLPVALLHCVSNYPAAFGDCNLRAMDTMRRAFGVPIGYSDHTLGLEASLAAVALGASVIEKHFTLDRELPGPDHRASLIPEELGQLVAGIRNVEAALGDGHKRRRASELDTARVARRSLVMERPLAAGTRLSAEMLVAKRPGSGVSAALRQHVIGRVLRRDVEADELFAWEMID